MILLLGSILSQFTVMGVESYNLGYTVDVLLLDATNMFDKFQDIYVLKDRFVYPDNFVSVDWIIGMQVNRLNDWDPQGHPYLTGFTLSSGIGNYTNDYFRYKIRGDLYSFIRELGYNELYVNVFGNVIEVSIGDGEKPDTLLDNVDRMGNIYMNWIVKMLRALNNEGFYLPFNKFLEGIGGKIKVVIIKTPFKRYSDEFILDASQISMTDPSYIYMKYGFMIQSIGPETYFGVYSMEIPLSCNDPSIGIKYNISSIQDILDRIRQVKNILFGIDKEVIIIPTKECYTGNPFTKSDSKNIDNSSKEISMLKPIMVKEINMTYTYKEYTKTMKSTEHYGDKNDLQDTHYPSVKENQGLYLGIIILILLILAIGFTVKLRK